MFESLSNRLNDVFDRLRRHGALSEDDVGTALREIRVALLEADVALPVVREFVASIREKAVGAEVLDSLTPGQALVGVVHRELAGLMGGAAVPLDLATQPPAIILLAGLQSQSKEVIEAAAMDGAGAFRVFGAITLPHLRPYIDIAVLLGTVMLIQVFDPVAIMTKGTGGSKTLPYLLYERAFIGLDVGQAAAFGVITVIITIVVATVALRTLFKVFMNGGTR